MPAKEILFFKSRLRGFFIGTMVPIASHDLSCADFLEKWRMKGHERQL